MGNRNEYLDALRGAAILIVVMGHALQSANGMIPSLPAQQIIMTFWMPLFFLLAGYADGMTKGGAGLGKKVLRLLVPYLIWSQVVFACDLYRGDVYTLAGHASSFVNSKFWFLRVLFLCWMSCYLYRRLRGLLVNCCLALRIAVPCVMAACMALLTGGRAMIHYLPLYLVGIAVFWAKGRVPMQACWTFLISGSIAFAAESYFLLKGTSALTHRILDLSMAFTGSLFVCLMVMGLARLKWSMPFLTFCGRQSLGIYAIHWCLLFYTDILGLHSLVVKGVDVHLVGLIGFVGWTLISVCLVWFFGRIDVLNCLLLGNKSRRARA